MHNELTRTEASNRSTEATNTRDEALRRFTRPPLDIVASERG